VVWRRFGRIFPISSKLNGVHVKSVSGTVRVHGKVFYDEYFWGLASTFHNFAFHLVLSSPQPEDNWAAPVGLSMMLCGKSISRNMPTRPSSNTTCTVSP
jgi:Na+-transporting NADH:ubiquinone oxidoreductase subunit NqrF